jgi:hypothetical protein
VHFYLLPYALLALVLPLHIIYLLHLLSTNHKCTQPCYFPLLLKLAVSKEKMEWNSSMRSSRLRVAPVAIPVVLWSLPCYVSLRVVLVFKDIIYVIMILYIHDIWLSVSTFSCMCGTIDPGSCIR